MMIVFEYEANIGKTIQIAKKKLNLLLKNPENQEEACMQIKRIGNNKFIYDDKMKINDIFETTEKTDSREIYQLFDRKERLIKIFFSTKKKIIVVVWNHAIFDGIPGQKVIYKILGK